AYSLAMLFLDRIERAGVEPHLEILASDRYPRALKRARFGRYRRGRLGKTPPNLIERYMQVDGERIEVDPMLRRHVTFVEHDILTTPPPDDIDLVSCRNLLIYLAAASREKALLACSEALRPDGFLFLGPSEQPGAQISGLATIDAKWRIYRKIAPSPVDDALVRLSRAKRQTPAETVLPPDMDEIRPLDLPGPDNARPSDLDGVLTDNQRMLESTIDTLLASNDALRRRNRDLREENQRLTNAHAALDDIATMIAHDLKAPLRAVGDLADGLQAAMPSDDGETDATRWLQPMQHQLIGLNRLIDDLLTYARQGPADGTDLQSVDVGDLLRETLTLIGLPKGIKVLLRPPTLKVRTWRIPLACILRNLLGQAIERVGQAQGNIRIEAMPIDRFLEITIADDGRNARDESSGLGLAIVRQLLDAAGGRLTSCTAPPGQSHKVAFTWPIEGKVVSASAAEPSRST
ncbi:MAG: hypothetical protein OEU92_34985, partial [Alphaproteobacteria bacterium]|nr:hypothetical protein [Alphaproteobacteria bacterium]